MRQLRHVLHVLHDYIQGIKKIANSSNYRINDNTSL